MKVFAQGTDLGDIGSEIGLGPFAADPGNGIVQISDLISSIIGVMTLAAGIWFLFQVIIGGFHWISAGGDKQKLHDARYRLNNAFIGLIVVVMAWALLSVASKFFGVDFLLTNPGNVLQ